jgi:hypothetical protein
MHLVQLLHPDTGRAVALVRGDQLRVISGARSIYELAERASDKGATIAALAEQSLSQDDLPYDEIYQGRSRWTLLPAFDHPDEAARCLVTGTGLTHKASALNRQAMHAQGAGAHQPVTDSMRMFQWGLEGGRPAPGEVGVQPEWFYKGCGTILRAHGQPLDVPAFSGDGGEESEIVGLYYIDRRGTPRRVGFAIGNEFSDHVMEEKNYLYLAPSKLRTCAIGPELVTGEDCFSPRIDGVATVERGGAAIWSKPVITGVAAMSHHLENLEHHHFKHPAHRRPGDAHVHFFGADVFSFGDRVAVEDGDVIEISFPGFGRPLRNPVHIDRSRPAFVAVKPL